MKDKDIIKAFEYCANDLTNDCTECPYVEKYPLCDRFINNDVIDLITRQQAEIDKLKTELKAMRGAANSLKMHYEVAQVEIERLQKIEIETDDFCRRLCRMRMLNGRAIASYEDLQNYIQYEKSEAVKEFAEKLKENSEIVHLFSVHTGDHYMVDIDDIDNLVKEMVGENNATT